MISISFALFIKTVFYFRYSSDILQKMNKLVDYNPRSDFLKRIRKESRKCGCMCHNCLLNKFESSLQYTKPRSFVEEGYGDTDTARSAEISRHRHRCSYYKCGITSSDSETRTNVCACQGSVCKRIHSAASIRKENYFETRSLSNLDKYSSHRCIHKFELDERLLPKPTNTDVYGTSRCVICRRPFNSFFNAPIEKTDKEVQVPSTSKLARPHISDVATSTRSLQKNYSFKEKSSSNKYNLSVQELQNMFSEKSPLSAEYRSDMAPLINSMRQAGGFTQNSNNPRGDENYSGFNLKKLYSQTGYYPCESASYSFGQKLSSDSRKIGIGSRDVIVELNTDSLAKSKSLSSNTFFEKCKQVKLRPNITPSNSLALRYQKGVLY